MYSEAENYSYGDRRLALPCRYAATKSQGEFVRGFPVGATSMAGTLATAAGNSAFVQRLGSTQKPSRQRNQDDCPPQNMRIFAMPTRIALLLPIQDRIVRLRQLISILENGCNVSVAEMRGVVEPPMLKSLQLELKSTTLSIPRIRRPHAVNVYADLLRVADQLNGQPRTSMAPPVNRRLKMHSHFSSAESAYGCALEFLEEQLESDGSILNWLDRWPNFYDHAQFPSPEANDVPRLLTSRSSYARGYREIKNQQLHQKIAVLRRCLDICIAD